MPTPVEALVYSLRVRLLAAAAGALGVEAERGLRPAGAAPRALVVRLPLDHGLDLRDVATQFRGVTATPSQLHMDTSQEWRDSLVAMLREVARLVRARERMTA
jgi:hypothetical protein